MAEGMKGKAQEAGHKVTEAATKVGHKISEGAEKAADWVKEKTHAAGHRAEEMTQKMSHASACGTAKSTAEIRDHMDVIGSCGNRLGVVDHVEGDSIKLTRKDSPDDRHHFIPLG